MNPDYVPSIFSYSNTTVSQIEKKVDRYNRKIDRQGKKEKLEQKSLEEKNQPITETFPDDAMELSKPDVEIESG